MTGGSTGDRGTVSLELVILTPAILAFVLVIVAAGRLTLADQAVDHAAFEAARSASLARSAGEARASSEAAAAANLSGGPCTAVNVAVDLSAFSSPPGTSATVTAVVSCTVPLADLGLPGLPGVRVLTGTGVSPLDTYRERS